MIKVYVNKHDRSGNVVGRKVVSANLIEERPHSVLVQLPSGKVIVRKKDRDVVKEDA